MTAGGEGLAGAQGRPGWGGLGRGEHSGGRGSWNPALGLVELLSASPGRAQILHLSGLLLFLCSNTRLIRQGHVLLVDHCVPGIQDRAAKH